MLAALLKIGEILVGEIPDMLAHVVLRHLEKKHADPIAHAARAAVQHEPDLIALIQAHFDKMIAGPKRAKMVHVIAAVELGIFVGDRFVADLQLAPYTDLALRQLAPTALVLSSAVVRPPV